ncbi:MAG: outer membrane protein assembly factor [Candidatus Marinimicrobia bacterium]|nr:outer membrane protein assembly factor [Candidatus Neomarinimicrobiota bacterium]
MGLKKQIQILLTILFVINFLSATQTGWKFSGIPAVNYNSDDGFGYGVIGSVFNYKEGGYQPYYLKINSTIFRTTGGKQLYSIFIDSPFIPNQNYRLNLRLQLRDEDNYPYFGPGNSSTYNADYLDEDKPNLYKGDKYYYFRKKQVKLLVNLQRQLYSMSKDVKGISGLVGFGFSNSENFYKDNDGMSTKLLEQVNQGIISEKEFKDGLSNFVKFGLIYDTRNREVNPSRGAWTSFLTELHSEILGGDFNFTRMTLLDRRYFKLWRNLNFANRIIIENLSGTVPLSLQYPFGSSMKVHEGIGGVRTLRGILKNRYFGDTEFFMNSELRYTFLETKFLNQNFQFTAVTFLDIGRVWENEVDNFGNIHHSQGLGSYITWNENFTVFIKAGFSDEAGMQIYLDTDFLF